MINAYPGIYLVTLLKQKPSDGINLGQDKNKRILKGKIISVGEPTETKYGGMMKPKRKRGDILYFLSYEGNYDKVIGDTYAVLFDDARAYEEDEK